MFGEGQGWGEVGIERGRVRTRRGGGGYSHTLPTRVCAAQRGHDFEAPDF